MALVALPFIVSTLGGALPYVGAFVVDVLAFTGASAIIEDVADLIMKPSETETPSHLKHYDIGETVSDIGENVGGMIAKRVSHTEPEKLGGLLGKIPK